MLFFLPGERHLEMWVIADRRSEAPNIPLLTSSIHGDSVGLYIALTPEDGTS